MKPNNPKLSTFLPDNTSFLTPPCGRAKKKFAFFQQGTQLEIQKFQTQGESGHFETMTGAKQTQDQTQKLWMIFLFIQ